MAEHLRHAAGQATYEVCEVLDGDPSVELAVLFRCTDYVHAVEFAFELLERRDPRREGIVGALQVVKHDHGQRETVWTYSHSAQEGRPDPARKWGFDVTRHWQAPAATGTPARPFARRVYRRA
jgi:hypothetical protein